MGRPCLHGQPKAAHTIRVTDTAWDGLKRLASETGVSLSEYLEALGKNGTLPS
ncbi:hypothetical protein [Moorena sp. SIO4G3]|uniref:hypothetical protein n=1 Tax=Moorena sp. SIO4G3 TaxID=2607821 RepID=UPI0025E65037|nr:hypothetical protein [Moorena sp. SIO4G3]